MTNIESYIVGVCTGIIFVVALVTTMDSCPQGYTCTPTHEILVFNRDTGQFE